MAVAATVAASGLLSSRRQSDQPNGIAAVALVVGPANVCRRPGPADLAHLREDQRSCGESADGCSTPVRGEPWPGPRTAAVAIARTEFGDPGDPGRCRCIALRVRVAHDCPAEWTTDIEAKAQAGKHRRCPFRTGTEDERHHRGAAIGEATRRPLMIPTVVVDRSSIGPTSASFPTAWRRLGM